MGIPLVPAKKDALFHALYPGVIDNRNRPLRVSCSTLFIEVFYFLRAASAAGDKYLHQNVAQSVNGSPQSDCGLSICWSRLLRFHGLYLHANAQ